MEDIDWGIRLLKFSMSGEIGTKVFCISNIQTSNVIILPKPLFYIKN
jgi:hypothetical protein